LLAFDEPTINAAARDSGQHGKAVVLAEEAVRERFRFVGEEPSS
jgi:hypothetical protein